MIQITKHRRFRSLKTYGTWMDDENTIEESVKLRLKTRGNEKGKRVLMQ